MSKFVWKKSYNTGFSIIDEEHRVILDSLNEIEENILKGAKRKVFPHMIEEVEDFLQRHISYEEDLMEKHQLPSSMVEHHKEEHEEFYSTLSTLIRSINETNIIVKMTQIQDFLKDYMIIHVLGTDQEMTDYIKNNKI